MNKIVIRFYNVKNNMFFEVCFDLRLSFVDNFKLLNSIYPVNMMHIYDMDKEVFLKLDVKLEEFGFPSYISLYIFE